MSFEIEIKLPINEPEQIMMKLDQLKFQKEDEIQEIDTYFNSQFHNVKEHDEALRIRRSVNLASGKEKTQINFKGPKLDTVSMSRQELETEIIDGEVMRNILEHLEYRPVASVEKVRKYYVKETMTACVDQVKDLGNFLELEMVVSQESKREDCLAEIENILQKLGYGMEDTVRDSYLSMLTVRG